MPDNGSIAIWCVPRQGSNDTELEAHFNYWRISGDEGRRRSRGGTIQDFVEVGLMLTDVSQIESICIYIPATLQRDMIEDCSPYLATPEFAQGIFNEVLAITSPTRGGVRCVALLDQDDNIFCRVHTFSSSARSIDPTEIGIAHEHGGTVVTITRTAINEACNRASPPARSYFRLRLKLKGKSENPFIKTIPTPDRLLHSGFHEIEYIDFRVNEARTLPPPIESRMRSERARGGAVRLKLIAFLTAVPVHAELSVSNTPSHKMRLLEPNWTGYIGHAIPEGMVVYHWKREEAADRAIADFSAFVKLETRRSGKAILTRYLFVAFLIGLIGNLVAAAVLAIIFGG